MNSAKWLSIGVVVSLIFTLTMNSLSNTTMLGEGTIGSVSARYTNLFTPAGYAFSIWGVIYLGWLLFSVIQFKFAWSDTDWASGNQLRLWFILTNLLNAFWLVAWLNEKLGVALILMLGLLVGLLAILVTVESQPEVYPKLWVRFPVQLYAGWITVATIANTSAYLTQLDFSWGLSANGWTLLVLVVALSIYLMMLWKLGLPVYALVGVWATIAISYKQWSQNTTVAYASLAVAIILAIAIIWKSIR